MALSTKRPVPRTCASFGCTKPIGNDRAASGFRRCAWCAETFAKSTPKTVDPRTLQGTMFEVQRPKAAPRPTPAPIDRFKKDPDPTAPEPPPPPTDVQRTKELARRLEEARQRANADTRAARLVKLCAEGMSLADAIDRIEKEPSP